MVQMNLFKARNRHRHENKFMGIKRERRGG